MNTARKPALLFLAIICFALIGATVQDSGENVDRRGTIPDDYYAAGGTVTIDADVRGDVAAAGGTVTIGNHVRQDVMVAGGTVTVRGRVDDDVRAAGGEVTVDARIGDDALVSGGNITLTPNTSVGGNAFIAGGKVSVNGTINGDLKAAGGSVVINSVVHGNVNVEADQVVITSAARIDGNLNYRSPEKGQISPGSVIHGKTSYSQSERYHRNPATRFLSVITFSVAGIALLLVFPNFTRATSTRMASHFWKNLGLGFAVLVATPAAVFLLLVSFAGVWIGLPILLIYLVALVLSYILAGFYIAWTGSNLLHFDVRSRGRLIVAMVVSFLLFAALRFIPVLGSLVVFILVLTALGAMTLQFHELYRSSAVATPVRKKSTTKRRRS